MFNTNTLGYKLVSGKLKKSRKHSEQLNKYLAGLFDADGCISLELVNNKYVHLRFTLTQAASVDNDFELIRSLQAFYRLGTLRYSYNPLNDVSRCDWRLSTKQSKMMFNLIGKHLRIKATHFKNLIDIQSAFKGTLVSSEEWERIRAYRDRCRSSSTWLKRPKHLSYSWVAGYLDGDGCYRFRRSQNTLAIKATSSDIHILEKLQEDFKGSILENKRGTYKTWRRGLGKGNISFSLPFLKKMRAFSCNRQKYMKIQKMITYLEGTKRVAKTKQKGSNKEKR